MTYVSHQPTYLPSWRAGRETPLCAALACVLLLCAAASDAQPETRQILVLQSFDRGNLVIDHFTSNFRVDLDKGVGSPVNIIQIVVGPIGFVGAPETAVVDYIRTMFADRSKPDLIVTLAGPAALFARKYRQQLFPEVPLLFAAVDQRFLNAPPLGDNETAVASNNDYAELVDEILQLRPRTRQVFMVTGSGQLGRFWRGELEQQLTRLRDRVTFIWSADLSLSEILRRCANLPDDAAIFFILFDTDAAGTAYADERVLADLQASATAPIFAVQSAYLGAGTVGGSLMSIPELSRNTADAAVRLLNGAPPRTIRVPPQSPGQPTFDWRELQRWNIPESRLPAGSVVRYRGPSLWKEYRRTALTAAGVLAIQSLLIVGLLYQRRERQRAELESRRNLSLAADASRRATMSALTSSIGHELSQPLSAMMYNAHALEMMVTANRATPDTMGEILSDIQSQGVRATQIIDRHRSMLRSHQLDKAPVDLHAVINESLALVAHDIAARNIDATVHLSTGRCVVSGDQVLLQQVLVNLIMNAMDAMAETPLDRRQLTIRTDVGDADVEVSVRDTGTGLPPHLDGTLFTPFVTTKSHGLGIGLTIVRTILAAHAGKIEAHNNADGGATFTVTLRCSDVTQGLH